jgi:hypothetical protein
MLPTTIEDLVIYVCQTPQLFDPKELHPRDRSILYSMAAQLKRNLPFTSKQADLVIKIMRDNQHLYSNIDNLNLLLETPVYKYAFRVIDTTRKIFLDEEHQEIRVKFPFDKKINKALEKVRGRHSYNIASKCHVYKLQENNILELIDSLKDFKFEIDKKLLTWYNEIKKISNDPENYIPTADIVNGNIVLKNSNNSLIEYFNENRKGNIVADAYLAKFMGVMVANSLALNDSMLEQSNQLTRKIIFNKHNKFVISADSLFDKFNIAEFIKESMSFPILIFMNETDNLITQFKQWVTELNKNNIENQHISVLFRSNTHHDFNNFIKDNNLNNLIDQNTKVVFVKNKVPKILYKLNFKPKLIITSSSFYVHYTGHKMIENHPLVIYYTEGPYERMADKFVKL